MIYHFLTTISWVRFLPLALEVSSDYTLILKTYIFMAKLYMLVRHPTVESLVKLIVVDIELVTGCNSFLKYFCGVILPVTPQTEDALSDFDICVRHL
jgi:hypothetical protein